MAVPRLLNFVALALLLGIARLALARRYWLSKVEQLFIAVAILLDIFYRRGTLTLLTRRFRR